VVEFLEQHCVVLLAMPETMSIMNMIVASARYSELVAAKSKQ
jgi:hypothetical protein